MKTDSGVVYDYKIDDNSIFGEWYLTLNIAKKNGVQRVLKTFDSLDACFIYLERYLKILDKENK